jgi:hypothetical protein
MIRRQYSLPPAMALRFELVIEMHVKLQKMAFRISNLTVQWLANVQLCAYKSPRKFRFLVRISLPSTVLFFRRSRD